MTRILFRSYLPVGLLTCLLFLFLTPNLLLSADLRLQSDTLFRAFERDTSGGNDELITPAYQYLQLDATAFQAEGFSFHAYGWGRLDLSDSAFYDDNTAGELLYAYLDYHPESSAISARLGRQYVFSGIANDAIDGIWLKGSLTSYLTAEAYAGQPVSFSTTNGRSGDSIYGGRIGFNQSIYSAGLSYKASENDGETAVNQLGFDLAAALPWNTDFYGYSTHNLETEGWAEHLYELNISLGAFNIRPYFESYAFKDYFDSGDSSPNPFKLLAQSGEEISTFGIDASWTLSENFTLGGKAKHLAYEKEESSNFVSFLVSWNSDVSELTSAGVEIGYMNGEAAQNDYLLVRLFGYRDELRDQFWVDFVSGDITYADYDEDIFGRSYSLFTSMGAGKKFLNDRLTIRLSADYSQDPYFDENLQALLTASFNFDFSM